MYGQIIEKNTESLLFKVILAREWPSLCLDSVSHKFIFCWYTRRSTHLEIMLHSKLASLDLSIRLTILLARLLRDRNPQKSPNQYPYL